MSSLSIPLLSLPSLFLFSHRNVSETVRTLTDRHNVVPIDLLPVWLLHTLIQTHHGLGRSGFLWSLDACHGEEKLDATLFQLRSFPFRHKQFLAYFIIVLTISFSKRNRFASKRFLVVGSFSAYSFMWCSFLSSPQQNREFLQSVPCATSCLIVK